VLLYIIALTLLNAAIYFAVTPKAAADYQSNQEYLGSLVGLHARLSIIIAIIAIFILQYTAAMAEWDVSRLESMLIFVCFLSFLNLDFYRRAQYILGNTKGSGLVSLKVFIVRICIIFAYQPQSFLEFLVVITISILVVYITKINWFFEISKFNKAFVAQHLLLSKWSIANSLMLWVVMHGLVVFTGYYLEGTLMAVLITLRSISNIFNVLLELLETYLPMKLIGFKLSQVEGVKLIANVATFGLVISFLIGGLIYTYAEELLFMILGDQYSRYWFLLLYLWIGNTMFFLTRLYGVSFRVLINPILELKATFIGFVVLCFCVVLVDLTELHHVVAIMVASQISMGAAQLIITPFKRIPKTS